MELRSREKSAEGKLVRLFVQTRGAGILKEQVELENLK